MGMFLIRDLVSPRAWLALIHHLVGVFVGLVICVLLVTGFALGFGLIPLALVGLPVIGVTMRLAEGIAHAERARFGFLLGVRIPAWPTGARAGYRWGVVPRWPMLRDRTVWGSLGYALLRPLVSSVALTFSVGAWAYGLVMLTLPLYNSYLPAGGADLDGTVIHGGRWMLVSVAGGIVLVLAAPQIARGLAAMDAGLTRWLLSPPSDLAARVTELEESREAVVDAAEAERRRIERDLHDGAQQRLVTTILTLKRARHAADSGSEDAAKLIDEAVASTERANDELRELALGIHPAILSSGGLAPALKGLARRSPIPVTLDLQTQDRLPERIEVTAYYVVSEALTNAAKHSQASAVHVTVTAADGDVRLSVSDDGVGGADPAGGSGLVGLKDRAGAAGGTLTVESPPGKGT
ncbi:MAG: sensor histidine kinase, partial [Streptosporangiaceae bacterium]|nr:sensor histidine kinase [Streptosporangiaceae bacterium]